MIDNVDDPDARREHLATLCAKEFQRGGYSLAQRTNHFEALFRNLTQTRVEDINDNDMDNINNLFPNQFPNLVVNLGNLLGQIQEDQQEDEQPGVGPQQAQRGLEDLDSVPFSIDDRYDDILNNNNEGDNPFANSDENNNPFVFGD